MAATNTYKSFLMKKDGTTYTKLLDIKDYPDLGGAPEMLETTTLSDKAQTYIPGIQSTEALAFTANYDASVYNTLLGLKDVVNTYAIWFGGTESGSTVTPTGSEGQFEFDGKLSVNVTGAGVNEVRNMTVTIAPSTPIEFSIPSA